MNMLPEHELISGGLQRISETARFLGVSRSLVYRLINTGSFRPCVSVAAAESRFWLSVNSLQRICFVRHHRQGDEKEQAIRLGRMA